ncbi:hypothetical protein THRCLA_10458, partial [Thraustotheca clavata]
MEHFYAITTPTNRPGEPIGKIHDDAPQPKWQLPVHWFIGLLMAFSIFSITVYFTPFVHSIMTTVLNPWFNVNPKVKESGHSEMVMYTYFFFGMILPMFVAFILIRIVTKGKPAPVPHLEPFLHRKPSYLKFLVSYGELLFLAVVIVGNVILFYYFYQGRVTAKSSTNDRIRSAALSLGFSTLYNMAFLALPATKHCFWMEWLGIPYAHGV